MRCFLTTGGKGRILNAPHFQVSWVSKECRFLCQVGVKAVLNFSHPNRYCKLLNPLKWCMCHYSVECFQCSESGRTYLRESFILFKHISLLSIAWPKVHFKERCHAKMASYQMFLLLEKLICIHFPRKHFPKLFYLCFCMAVQSAYRKLVAFY